jgi:hypothetical protein
MVRAGAATLSPSHNFLEVVSKPLFRFKIKAGYTIQLSEYIEILWILTACSNTGIGPERRF